MKLADRKNSTGDIIEFEKNGRPTATWTKASAVALTALIVLLVTMSTSCVNRQFNTEAQMNTLFQSSQPRIAVDYLGLGWCYYLEEKSTPMISVKSDLVDEVVDVDLNSGIEIKNKYQIVYRVRQFKQVHPRALEFDAIRDWRTKTGFAVNSTETEWKALESLESELTNLRSHINARKLESAICKAIDSENKNPDLSALNKSDAMKREKNEYVVRCLGDSGELMTRSHLEQLTESGYQAVRKVLTDLTTAPQFAHWHKNGAPCRQRIRQMEIGRGQFLGSEKKKVF